MVPNPKAIYKLGQNIWLRYGPKAAQKYRELFAQGDSELLNKVVKTTGYPAEVLDDMAVSRMMIKGKGASAFKEPKGISIKQKALNNMHREIDYSDKMLPKGARGTDHYGYTKPQVPKDYELDDMQNIYFKSGSPAQAYPNWGNRKKR